MGTGVCSLPCSGGCHFRTAAALLWEASPVLQEGPTSTSMAEGRRRGEQDRNRNREEDIHLAWKGSKEELSMLVGGPPHKFCRESSC